MFDIIRSNEESDRISDFVAIGNLFDRNTTAIHAAFIIKYNSKLFEFHYTGKQVEFTPIQRDYFHKITDTILPNEVPAFIAQCKNILKKARPTYGFFYSGEWYDKEGNHISLSNLSEVMTCVGFCLNVFKGFLENDYLVYSDWNKESHEQEEYLEKFCKEHQIDPNKIAASHRRVTPLECLTSCFFYQLPIKKATIDKKIVEVNEFFTSRLN